jgi:hypothetical protein
MRIQATRSRYQDPHTGELTSTNIRPVQPYTQQDIHDAFKNLKETVLQLGTQLIDHGHMTPDQFVDQSFKYYPQKKRIKQKSGGYQKQKRKFVTRMHRLRHNGGQGEPYTVKELLVMLENKIDHTMPNNKRELQDFTEAMLHRTNLSLKWFKDLAEKYFQHDLQCQRQANHQYQCVNHCPTQQWHQRLDQTKIDIEWS